MAYVNPIIEYAEQRGITLDRELYLAACYPDGLPDPWTPELEDELPEQFQHGRR
jgi:hypothetical protein